MRCHPDRDTCGLLTVSLTEPGRFAAARALIMPFLKVEVDHLSGDPGSPSGRRRQYDVQRGCHVNE